MLQSPRIGVIGGGAIAEMVHIPGLVRAGAEVRALAHPREDRLRALGERFGIQHLFAQSSHLLQRDDIDAVVICSPNATHESIVAAAIEAEKHVLCEKPLTLRAGDALELARMAEQRGIRHMVAFTFRFVPAMRYLHALIRDGAIGRLLHWRAVNFTDSFADPDVPLGWRGRKADSGGGALMDVGPHLVDAALWIAGRIEEVAAAAATFTTERPGRYGGRESVDADDSCVFAAKFESGALGTFELSRVVPGRGGTGRWNHQVIEVAGTEGAIEYRLERPYHLRICTGELVRSHAWAEVEVPEALKKEPGSSREPALPEVPLAFRLDQAVRWVRSIEGIGPHEPDFWDGVMCQAVLDAVDRSFTSGRWEGATIDPRGADPAARGTDAITPGIS